MPTYAVTFTVTDAEGKTVTDAVVTIEGQTGTHTEGRWVFALPDGAGTQAAPYQIESGEQLAWLADIVSAGSGDAGGIVGRAAGTTNIIENCGNEANVSGGCNVGGILGNSQSSSTTVTVAGCYNSGSITAGDRAGGIIGRYNNSNPRITGGYNTLTDCYYLTGSIPAGTLDNGANAMTLTEMQTTLLAALGEENWKQVRGVNQGLPILGWQKATSPAVFAQLAKYTRFSRESYITDDGEESSLPTSLLMWVPEENAQSYTVTLWQAVKTWIPLNEEEKAAYDAAQTAEGKADAIATEQALCALTAYARLLDGRTSLYDMTDALDGQTADVPDDTAADDRQPAKTTPVVVWIALGAVAVGGGAALVATRRRRGK